MTNADAAHKITRAHHSRKAVVYLRQASLAQVKRNTESQRLQYALADTAKLYGFRHKTRRIVVVQKNSDRRALARASRPERLSQRLAVA